MSDQVFDEHVAQLYQWIGQRLSSCPTRDGIAFYHRTDKVLKVVRQKKGWHLQFNVPIPERPGMVELTPEEVRRKKLGKTRWVYRGESDSDARELVLAALNGLPHRQLIDPAMSRDDVNTVCRATCPCLKKMEHLTTNRALPEDIRSSLRDAHGLLLSGENVQFLQAAQKGIEDVTAFLLRQRGIEPREMGIAAKVDKLIELQVVAKYLRDEVEMLFAQPSYERFYSSQERAYPLALMFISLLSKLAKACS
ncbi:hypothetical protein CEB3_c15080 [Peptococcaceae bacterium CEB3]|nr:hypothetical protein CEB3_c15080 [Peptococcaceae bacterium CEB3]